MFGLDFESFGSLSLPTVGLDRYVNDEFFRPLLAAVVRPKHQPVVIDFTQDYDHALAEFYGQVVVPAMSGELIAAHNAGFERAVMKRMGYDLPADKFVDTAVIARGLGYGGSLEAAAEQMLGAEKMPDGKRLIQTFSIPAPGKEEFDTTLPVVMPHRWQQFKDYCILDAQLCLRIAEEGFSQGSWLAHELIYSHLTMEMNSVGWPVDTVLVEQLRSIVERNSNMLLDDFRRETDSDLNLQSNKQLQEWCKERGIRATSFDEQHVAKLIEQLRNKLDSMSDDHPQWDAYQQVLFMLQTKKQLGGSSLKKLDKIHDTVSDDLRLRDQYMHLGAGATFRATARGVQMQNLPRLYGEGDDIAEAAHWSNTEVAHNLRQVFRAEHPDGRLIVGDFGSVESRMLAWQAGEEWKLQTYADGRDVYRMLGAKKFKVGYDEVTKDQRTFGKVGELACGYGAGGGAVKSFAEGMGVFMTEQDAAELVSDWRAADPATVEYWRNLEAMLNRLLALRLTQEFVSNHMLVRMELIPAPESLSAQVGQNMFSLKYSMHLVPPTTSTHRGNEVHLLTRFIHGVHRDGRNVAYFKPTSRKTGQLWVDEYVDPKTGVKRSFNLYGGKLAGLLTQSLSREYFYHVLSNVDSRLRNHSNVQIIGQFHDEIVLEWQPEPFEGREGGLISLSDAVQVLHQHMKYKWLPGFPPAAEVHADRRYIK